MKMMLNGPQAITIFPVAKDDAVPQSAKSSSFATPQGYVVTENGNLYLYIKGQEYRFVDREMHEAIASEAHTDASHAAALHTSHDAEYATMAAFHNLQTEVSALKDKVDCIDKELYMPLKHAFAHPGEHTDSVK